MKKVMLLAGVLGVIGVGSVLLLTQQKATISTNTLSQRAQEYLKNKNERDNSSLKYAAVSESQDSDSQSDQRIKVGDCFSFVVPFRISSLRSDDPCFVSIALRSPKGTLTAYEKEAAVMTLDDVPGVPMRRKNPSLYEEKKQTLNGTEYVLFRNTKEYFEESAFALTQHGYLVITVQAQSGERNEEGLLTLLQSVTINEL